VNYGPKLIGFYGKSESGKDTAADVLCNSHGYFKIAFADPMKRFAQEVFRFKPDQLWGDLKNVPDKRYGELTPRTVLQVLGTEFGRRCYPDIWVDYALHVTGVLLQGGQLYTACQGLFESSLDVINPPTGVVIADVRFENEVRRIKEAGGLIVRIQRPQKAKMSASESAHVSETAEIPEDLFDVTLLNDGSKSEFEARVHETYGKLK
jgi:hypothetical protein